MNNKRFGASDLVLVVLNLFFLLGIVFVFHPCGPMEDGSWMHCHWAGVAVTVCAAVLLVLSVIHLLAPGPRVKTLLAILEIPVALAAAIIPRNIIPLCMMADMRCRAIMRPAAIVFAILVIAAAVFDLILQRKRGKA